MILDVAKIIFLFTLFAYSHTFLAALKLKRELANRLGNRIAFYRLFYNVSSIVFFLMFYTLSPKPSLIIYDLQYPFDIITFALQVISLGGLIWAVIPVNLKEFVGISQIERYMKGVYKTEELDEKQNLKFEGAFKFVRHPIYAFCILFLGLRPTMTLFYLAMFICIVVYFYIGSIYEERKLTEIFGEEYKNYQKSVPRFFPIKII